VGLSAILEHAQARHGLAVIGIVNTTPDSFFDGGLYAEATASSARVKTLVQQGADIVDLGAESTRPGAPPVPAAEQIERLRPALERALELGAVVSVDTKSPEVADFALGLGAHIINDVSCLEDAELARVVAAHQRSLLLMHSRGALDQTKMAGFSSYPEEAYGDVVSDVAAEWQRARARAVGLGVPLQDIAFDPGLGFSKNANHSWQILTRLGEFSSLGAPIVVGPSRKSFIASLDGSAPTERLGGSIASCLVALSKGAAAVRVHDVAETLQALSVWRRAMPEVRRP
jgi:dihydropteroate synthase